MIAHHKLAEKVVLAAKAEGITIVTAESCTGGMVAASLTDITGSSAVFDRGFVTYSYASKTDLLDVPNSMLTEFGAVSERVAKQMALGALAASTAEISIAITGVAGPGADGAKPEGLVWFALARNGSAETLKMDYGAVGRDQVRLASVETALIWLHEEITRPNR